MDARRRWFAGVGASLDGVVAKRTDLPYQSGNRDGMVKVKNLRTADCVVGGFRHASKSKEVGLVVEVQYDHFTNNRFRHGTRFLRWRPDKSPRQCTMAQVRQEASVSPLKLISAKPSRRAAG